MRQCPILRSERMHRPKVGCNGREFPLSSWCCLTTHILRSALFFSSHLCPTFRPQVHFRFFASLCFFHAVFLHHLPLYAVACLICALAYLLFQQSQPFVCQLILSGFVTCALLHHEPLLHPFAAYVQRCTRFQLQ